MNAAVTADRLQERFAQDHASLPSKAEAAVAAWFAQQEAERLKRELAAVNRREIRALDAYRAARRRLFCPRSR